MFPPIPSDVLLALSKVFPDRAADPRESYEDLMWRGGQVSVVRWLQRAFDEQQDNILTPEEFQDVLSAAQDP